MKRLICLFLCAGVGVLSGCKTTPTNPKNNSVRKKSDLAMKELDAEIPKQKILFPEYFILKECTLDQHGQLPNSIFIAANLHSERPFKSLFHEYHALFSKKGWSVKKMELGKRSFRFLAEKKPDKIEIRVVQGIKHTQIFILFTPALKTLFFEQNENSKLTSK